MAYVNLPWGLFNHFLRICGSTSSPVLGYVMLLNLCLNRNVLSNVLGSDSKESACNAGDPGSIPGSGRSPGEGNVNPLKYSCLEKYMGMEPAFTSINSFDSQEYVERGK